MARSTARSIAAIYREDPMIKPLLFVAPLIALALPAAPAQAQLSRTFVSAASGNDANNCDRPTPCRTFQGAHDKTNPDGEITVLDAGGYGAVTITKSISIVNDGVGEASVLVSGGATGITINGGPASYVNLRGITIQGIGFGGGTGLRFNSGFSLTLTNCVVRNHTHDGIVFAPNAASNLAVSNTLAADNGGNGIIVQPTGTNSLVNVMLNRVEAYQNSGFGVLVDGTSSPGFASIDVNVMASAAANNGTSGFGAQSDGTHGQANLHVVASASTGNRSRGFESPTVHSGIVVGQSMAFGNAAGLASGNVFSYGDNYTVGAPFPFTLANGKN
jgi:hypothetical protein